MIINERGCVCVRLYLKKLFALKAQICYRTANREVGRVLFAVCYISEIQTHSYLVSPNWKHFYLPTVTYLPAMI